MTTQAKDNSHEKKPQKERHQTLLVLGGIFSGMVLTGLLFGVSSLHMFSLDYEAVQAGDLSAASSSAPAASPVAAEKQTLDREAYAHKLLAIANNGLLKLLEATTTVITTKTGSTTATSTIAVTPPTAQELASTTKKLWPAKAVYPNAGALLPFNRIVAYYGNFYSTGMGVLGQYPAPDMLQKLQTEVKAWEAADPETPVIPAIDYIAMTAQASPGADGTYRFRMPNDQIEHAIKLADDAHGIVILEVQAGTSNLQKEIESLEQYLILPQVHLAIDPEFHMVTGARPGTVIGTVDASEVNKAAQYLASLVREHDLPPKILVVHRFTYPMVTHTLDITPLPEVQVIMDMDGWGSPEKKFGTYTQVIEPYPVQFTGFKLFYKNDLKPPSTHMLTPAEVLKLSPQPIFIQYQ